MKNLLFLIILLVISINTLSQVTVIIIEDAVWGENINNTIIIDIPNKTIKVTNELRNSFKILELISNKIEGYQWKESIYRCVDKEGRNLYVSVKEFSYGKFNVVFQYPNLKYVYEGRGNKIN